jgi:hypothetical protein
MKIPIACSLSADDMGDRVQEWETLLARASNREPTELGYRLTFPREAALASALAHLAGREIECCPFFTFVVTMTNTRLQFDVEVPEDARDLVATVFGSQ